MTSGPGASVATPRPALLLALAVVAMSSMACAGGFDQAHSADVDSPLGPVATVASAGADPGEIMAVDHTFPAPRRSTERAASEAVREPSPSVAVTARRESGEVEVQAQHADALSVRITALTIGEALAYLSGGRISRPPDASRQLARGADAIDTAQRFDLERLVERGTGLFALDVEADSADEAAHLHTLLQLGPLQLAVEPVESAVRATVVDEVGEPVAGALVEVLDADGRTLAESRTDTSGRCVLRVEPDAPGPTMGPERFVVVRQGPHRALERIPSP